MSETQVFLSRIVGALVAALSVEIGKHYGSELPADVQAHLTGVLVFLVLVAYSVVHRLLSKAVNPEDKAGAK